MLTSSIYSFNLNFLYLKAAALIIPMEEKCAICGNKCFVCGAPAVVMYVGEHEAGPRCLKHALKI